MLAVDALQFTLVSFSHTHAVEMILLTASFGDALIHSTDYNGCNDMLTGLRESGGEYLLISITSFAASPFPCDSHSLPSSHNLPGQLRICTKTSDLIA
jgi:hypothetical protein